MTTDQFMKTYLNVAPILLHRSDRQIVSISTNKPTIMGILNLTPDSFSDGNLYIKPEDALKRARQMVDEGADIIDIGAESTRPMAKEISDEEEWKRLEKVLPLICKEEFPIALSIDTRNPITAQRASEMGVKILNLPFPQEFSQRIKQKKEASSFLKYFDAVVLMHSRGTPSTMKNLTNYSASLITDIVQELKQHQNDFPNQEHLRFIYDPGIGFAKDAYQSAFLLANLALFQKELGGHVLLGASRKFFLGHYTGLPVQERLAASIACALWSTSFSASIVRVHDVKETKAALTIWETLRHLQEPAELPLYKLPLHLE